MNNYDLIFNFKTVNGEQLTQEEIYELIGRAQVLTNSLKGKNIEIKKIVISQAMEAVNPL